MMGLAMIDRKVMLMISKQNLHFPSFPFLIQQPLLERVTESNHVCWFFLIHWVSMWEGPGIGPLLISVSVLPGVTYGFLYHHVLMNASLQI